jgi:hypothetical protein
MYVYDYLIYYLQPYGHIDIPQVLPAKLSAEEVLQTTQINVLTTESSNRVSVQVTVESTGNNSLFFKS